MGFLNTNPEVPFDLAEFEGELAEGVGPENSKTYATFMRSVLNLAEDPDVRVREPLDNHPWVFVAAMARAVNISQAPIYFWTEREAEVSRRRAAAERRGIKHWVPSRGVRRTALERHFGYHKSLGKRVLGNKSLEIDFDNDIWRLLKRPAPWLSQPLFVGIISMWLSVRGECMVVKLGENGEMIAPGDVPAQLWPLSPDLFEERIDERSRQFIGWWYTPQDKEMIARVGQRVPIQPWEIMHIKYPNPSNPYRGITPISAAAAGIELDSLTDSHNRAILRNGAEPGGLYSFDGYIDPQNKASFERQIKERHEGTRNRNRAMVLTGAWKFTPTSLTPKDMDYLEAKRWNRDMVLSIMRVPKACVGVTDDLNYATQRGQDKNLWDKSLLPDVRFIEAEFEHDLMQNEPDTNVIAFDLSGVEALREGLNDQVETARVLAGPELHVPPREAFDLVGLTEVPPYFKDDSVLVSPFQAVPLDMAIDVSLQEAAQASAGGDGAGSGTGGAGGQEGVRTGSQRDAGDAARLRALAAEYRGFAKEAEKVISASWRLAVRAMREEQAKRIADSAEANNADSLAIDTRPAIEKAFNSHGETLINLAKRSLESTIGSDLPSEVDVVAQSFMWARTGFFSTKASETARKAIVDAIEQAFKDGLSKAGIQSRVSAVFDTMRGTAKTRAIAKTEATGTLNGLRMNICRVYGVRRLRWVCTGESDRHGVFQDSGPQLIGSNFLLVDGYDGDGKGILSYPGDHRADIEETGGCGCFVAPVDR